MTIEDFYNAIPNKENVDKVFVNAVYQRIMNLKRLTEMSEIEEFTFTEATREGNMKTVKNPFWDIYRGEVAGVRQDLAELNLTPKSRNKGGKDGEIDMSILNK